MGNDVAQSTNLAPGDLNMIQAIRQGFGVRVSEGAEVMVQVVQLVRAAGCGSEGQWFEPVLAPPDRSTPDHPNPLSYWTNAARQLSSWSMSASNRVNVFLVFTSPQYRSFRKDLATPVAVQFILPKYVFFIRVFSLVAIPGA